MICSKQLGPYGAEYLVQLKDIDFTNIDPLAPTNVYGRLYNPNACKQWSFEAIGGGFIQTLTLDCLTGDLSISFGNTVNLNCLNLIATLHNDTVYVDPQYGNNATGVRENENLPFQTISAALLAALPGDTIWVRPGLYDEQVFLRNNIDMHFMPNAVLTYTGPGIVPVLGDNGVAVDCSIDGDLEINSFFKLPILISNAGSRVAMSAKLIFDPVSNIQSNGILNITAKQIGAFNIVPSGTGSINVICPSVVMTNVGFFSLSTGTSSLYGSINNVNHGTGRLNIFGTVTNILRVVSTGILEVHGPVTGAGLVITFGTYVQHGDINVIGQFATQTGGKSHVYGNVTSPIVSIGNTGLLRGRGTITSTGVGITTVSNGGPDTIDWEGDIISTGIGISSTFNGSTLNVTLNGNIVSGAECIKTTGAVTGTRYEVTGNLRPGNGFRAFHSLDTILVGSGEFVHNDGEIKGNSATAMIEIDHTNGGVGVPQLILRKSRIINAGAGNTIHFVAPVVSRYIIDGTTEISGAINSITATAPVDVRLYSTCISNIIHDGNITLLVNAAGYVVDPAVL